MCVYWYTGLSLICYLENICVRYVVDENIFSKFCLLGKKMVWVFRSAFEKMIIKNTQKPPPKLLTFPTHNQHQLKFDMIRVQYLGHRERVHRSFMKQYNLCDCRYHCRRLIFCLNILRYMYVFKIYVRAYFNQQLSVGIYTDQIHLQ